MHMETVGFEAEYSASAIEGRTVDATALLPAKKTYWAYSGSLTTPPCSEGLTWTVFKQPIEAAPEQIRQFASLFTNNARPIQKLNRRFLIEAN